MNFSVQRCIHLARLQLLSNRKLYAYAVLALAGILLTYMLYLVFYTRFGLHHSNQLAGFGGGWLIFTIVAATWHFHSIRAKSTRTQSLMLPVTAGERLAVAVFFNLIIYPVVYVAVYFISSGLAFYIDTAVMHHYNHYYNFFGNVSRGDLSFLKLIFLAMSFGLAAGMVFRKLVLVKVFVSIAAILISMVFLNGVIGKYLMASVPLPEKVQQLNNGRMAQAVELLNASPFSDWQFRSKTAGEITVNAFTVETPAYMQSLLLWGVVLVHAGLLAVVFFRLKEQEV